MNVQDAKVTPRRTYTSTLVPVWCHPIERRSLFQTRRLTIPTYYLATQRICALVVGIDKYRHHSPLQNAVRDARAVGSKLESKGATVVYAINCTISELNAKIEEYLESLREDDVAMLYFAGHGCEYGNALRMFAISEGDESNIDTDTAHVLVLLNKSVAMIHSFARVQYNYVHSNMFLLYFSRRMKRKKTQANIAIMDCCRNFLYKATTTRGATFIQPSRSHNDNYKGVLLAHACAPGHYASDGAGKEHGTSYNATCCVHFAQLYRISIWPPISYRI